MSQYIALYPNESSIKLIKELGNKLKLENLYLDHKFHLTLRFIKEDNFNNKQICEELSSIYSQQKELKLKSNKLDLFGNCLVLRLEKTTEIEKLQSNLNFLLVNKFNIEESKYKDFNPHLTLMKDMKSIPEIKFDQIELNFDTVKFIEKKESGEHHVLFSKILEK